jgi:hypothetical protein
MGTTEVRSPNSLTRDQYHPRRGESPGSRSSPSNARTDGGPASQGGPGPQDLQRASQSAGTSIISPTDKR